MYYCCAITEKGVMPHNEDAVLVDNKVINSGMSEQYITTPFIAAVSDGVSGELSGEVASKMCLEIISEIKYSSKVRLEIKLNEVHKRLVKYSTDNNDTHNMQATLCGFAVDENGKIITFNVGDSRLYLFRDGRVNQISLDQSLVQLLYDEGTITLEERRNHVHRNIIFPALGNLNSKPQIDIVSLNDDVEYGDVFLLCTDGLSDYVSFFDIEEILELPHNLPIRLKLLVEKALECGSKDNITIVAATYCQ